MAKLIGAQRMILQAIQDAPRDASGYVTDIQISQSTQIALIDVRDWLLTLMRDGYIDLSRTQTGYAVSMNATGRLELSRISPFLLTEQANSASRTPSSPQTILLLTANPNTQPLRLDEEARQIGRSLERARNRDKFRLVVKWTVTPDDLQRALLDYEPEIVHFSGHGSGADGLNFEDEKGSVHEMSGDALAHVFGHLAGNLKCVVLNACYDEVQANAISRQVNYVIGLKQGLGDKAATEFAASFYDALAAGQSFEKAFKFGVSATELSGISDDLAPVVKIRHG